MSYNYQSPPHSIRRSPGQSPVMQTRSSAARNTRSPEVHRGHCRSVSTSSGAVPLATPVVTSLCRLSRSACPLIDLTDSSPAGISNPSLGEPRYPVSKRRKTSQPPIEIAKVDLSNEADADEFSMRKNREELLKAQEGDRGGQRRKLAGFGCVICMEDEPTDLAVTPCGHMFCHLCLHGAIKASTSAINKSHGRCPVCRGKVSLKDVIAMEFKLLSKTQGKQKAR